MIAHRTSRSTNFRASSTINRIRKIFQSRKRLVIPHPTDHLFIIQMSDTGARPRAVGLAIPVYPNKLSACTGRFAAATFSLIQSQ